MPIPAQISVPIPTGDFDSLLLRNLIYSGSPVFTMMLSRYNAASGIEQPGSITRVKVTDATVLEALNSMIAQFAEARSISGTFIALSISGGVNGVALRGSMRLMMSSGVTSIHDVYAEAAKDQVFGGLLTAFLGVITTYNASAKVI